MKRIIRVFPRKTKATPTDAMAFVGDPPLPAFMPQADEVHVSIAFTWDLREGERLAAGWGRFYPTRIGGPALGDDGERFRPGQYLRPGFTITSRGCPNCCPWCLVPEREGGIRTLPIREGYIVQDNNLLACPDWHVEAVFEMLATQKRAAKFAGGFEPSRVTDKLVERLRAVRIEEVWLSYDEPGNWRVVGDAIRRLCKGGLSRRKVRCYVLCGFGDDTPEAAEHRLQHMLNLGALPFAMLWQPADRFVEYPRDWRRLQRKWTRPAAMLAKAKVAA